MVHCVCPFRIYTEPGYDYADFNNMTVGAQSHAILSITSHRHCFRISIPARPDDGLDDRNFFVAVELRVRKGMDMYTMGADVSLPNPLEIIIQPCKLSSCLCLCVLLPPPAFLFSFSPFFPHFVTLSSVSSLFFQLL